MIPNMGMYLLCNIAFRGHGDTSSKPGPRVNVCGVLGLLMMTGLFLCSTLQAQTAQGSIAGTVKDAKDAVVQDATVEVLNTATGVRQSTRTNNAGAFSVISLNPGSYNVVVSKTGFEKSVASDVTVSTAQLSTVNVTLAVGSETTTVRVTADVLLVKDDSNVTTTLHHAFVDNLPYPERSSLEATLLVPGVNGDPLQPGGISTENPGAFTSYVLPGASISIGGAPPGTNSILVDGSDVTQPPSARPAFNLSRPNLP